MPNGAETEAPEGADFVAPDESRRIADPEKAEAMARASTGNRSRAAEWRERALRDKRYKSEVRLDQHWAKENDMQAEIEEKRIERITDAQKDVQEIPADRLQIEREKSEAINNALEDVYFNLKDLKEKVKGDEALKMLEELTSKVEDRGMRAAIRAMTIEDRSQKKE
ncbi:MAG: hypothetical protein HY092_00715 [Candidatus Kerfeldbacteria bacterium]|nr:hypothetical protein [Candidatus Kerfeldbacteria bacterium]